MTEQEMRFFDALTRDRSESADMLEKPSMRGIKKSVVEKYSDQAHFIYELLQNADDAGATSAGFVLEVDRLLFAHNGIRLFSVTDPSQEEEDTASGKLSDINAITSIANSNKTEASIGKFGVGFKAVFQYTSTPFIYDPEVHFRIDRFIVPTIIMDDFKGRKASETMFVFPFDHIDRNQNEAYRNIAEKLKSLSYPLLFLSSLEDITFEFEDVIGLYGKDVAETIVLRDFFFKQTIVIYRLQFITSPCSKTPIIKTIHPSVLQELLWLISMDMINDFSMFIYLSSDQPDKAVAVLISQNIVLLVIDHEFPVIRDTLDVHIFRHVL